MSSNAGQAGSKQRVNWKFVILAIVLIFVANLVGGFLVGSIVGLTSGGLTAILVGGNIVVIVGLTIVGCMTPTNRWTNIILVAAGCWLVSLIDTLLATSSFSRWVVSIFWYALWAGVSGVISLLITALINSTKGREAP